MHPQDRVGLRSIPTTPWHEGETPLRYANPSSWQWSPTCRPSEGLFIPFALVYWRSLLLRAPLLWRLDWSFVLRQRERLWS